MYSNQKADYKREIKLIDTKEENEQKKIFIERLAAIIASSQKK